MSRNVVVYVSDSGGTPLANIKVVCWVYQFAANGCMEASTNSNGEAYFHLDVDTFAEIGFTVDNARKEIKRGAIQGEYHVYL